MEYRFDQIAYNSTEKKQPEDSDRAHYIGLEHLDSGCFEITRWGSDITPAGEKLIMHKGDILFGKRRAYQRKVGIAPFDGIFSAHGMVLRPKEDVIDKDYFPFFISSDQFMERAVRISVGGLSPTINWKDLREQVFDLPSLAEQRELAQKLWAAYQLKESYKTLLAATDEMVKSRFIEMFGSIESKKRLGEVASYINGFAFKPSDWSTSGLPIIRIQNLTGTNEVFNYYDGDYPAQVEVNNGDILISWSATLGVYVWMEGKALLNQHIFKVSFDKGYINRDYFIYAVTQKLDEMSTKTHGTTMRHIVKSDFDNTIIPFPSIDKQDQFAVIANQADKSKFEIKRAIEKIDKVMQALMQ